MSTSTTPTTAPQPPPCGDYKTECAPSRAVVNENAKNKKKNKKGDKEPRYKPDHISPPPKNAAEAREWNRMATRMDGFHSYFRATFQQMWEMSDKFEKAGFSLREFMEFCEEFERHLSMHHGIEERHVFPILAKKLPEFGEEHPEEHEEIHKGIDRLTAYIKKVKSKPSDYSPEEFKRVLASFGPILMYHLDEEVKTLGGDNLRRYYTLEEVRRLPM
ncbi:hypothetical protein T439DRAFT_327401 [Meredithblackwellia eburnea MCA 4105]